jgi:AraC-like DNA-binding protein
MVSTKGQTRLTGRGTISVSTLWARMIVHELKRQGADVEGALAKAGLELRSINNPDGWIPFEAHAQLLEIAAAQLKDDCFGLHFSKTVDIRDVGTLGYLGLACKTVEEGLHTLCRYLRVFSEAFQIEFKITKDIGTLLVHPQDPAHAHHRQAVEFAYCMVLHAYRQLTGKRISPSAVHFLHHRRSHLNTFTKHFGCPVKFNRNEGQIVFSRKTLATQIRSSDDRLLKILRAHADDLLRVRPRQHEELVHRIERRLSEVLPMGQGRAKIIATELGMSERTLIRRLREQNTSFADILDRLRQGLAKRYLAQPHLSFTHVAFLLGYATPSAFSAACKRWTGKSPREVRSNPSLWRSA